MSIISIGTQRKKNVSEDLIFWHQSLNDLLVRRKLHHILWQMKSESSGKDLDSEAAKLLSHFDLEKVETKDDPRMPSPLVDVKFLGNESRKVVFTSAR